jgi:hypothetical protein
VIVPLDVGSRLERTWSMWLYGRRGEMRRDYHWPQMVNGSLVGFEQMPKGANLSRPYVHSYLIHAYKGRGWDVTNEQIARGEFRARNANWVVAQDRLRPDEM